MSRPRVSFFVHSLSDNPIGRVVPLALALAPDYEVEVLGFTHRGTINETYRDLVTYRVLNCSLDVIAVLREMPRLGSMATGDVIYACKPLLTSLGPALIASGFGRRKPLLLDVEDDEWVPMGVSWGDFVRRDLLKGWRHATAWKYTQLMRPFAHCASTVTVSSTALQRRHGGVIVRHGPDERLFDPDLPLLREATRRRYGLPEGVPLALFAGTPQPHKGFGVLRRALLDSRARAWHLVLIGEAENPEFVACAEALPGRTTRLGFVRREDMPAVLHAVDAVPIPQLPMRFAQSQLPAKLLDAMAMGTPVAVSRVGDLPEILGEGSRGWLFAPGDAGGLAACLQAIAAHPGAAAERAGRARAWFLAEASRTAIRASLLPLLARALGRG